MLKKIPLSVCLAGLILLLGIIFIINGFAAVSGSKPKVDSKSQSPREVIHFLDAHLPGFAPAKVDSYLLRLVQLQSATLKTYEQKIFSEPTNSSINQYRLEDLNLQKVKEPELKTLVRSVFADGFKLSSAEGMVYPEIDYSLLFKRYRPFASESMSQYLLLMGVEADRHFAEDAALSIGLDQLTDRIIAAGQFISRYPKFSRVNDIRQLRQRYLTAYFIGLNNTPAFDYDTNRLNDKFRDNYQNTVSKYPDTQLAKLTTQYLRLLEKNNFEKTKPVLDFAKKYE